MRLFGTRSLKRVLGFISEPFHGQTPRILFFFSEKAKKKIERERERERKERKKVDGFTRHP